MAFFKFQAKPSVPEKRRSPYLNGREEWLERYGSYINRAAHWRMAAFLCLMITVVSITGNVIQANQAKTIPYIIEVDALGKTGVVARADTASATPKRLIQAEIAKCISDWRTVTADVELQQKMIERLSFFMAGSAKGVMLDSHTYEATVTIQLNPPTVDAVLLRNPGGVYITALSAHSPLPFRKNNEVYYEKDTVADSRSYALRQHRVCRPRYSSWLSSGSGWHRHYERQRSRAGNRLHQPHGCATHAQGKKGSQPVRRLGAAKH